MLAKRRKLHGMIWLLFADGLKEDQHLHKVPFLPKCPGSGLLSLDFIDDPDVRVVLRHFASEGAEVLLTSDADILKHRDRLSKLNLTVMRPKEWLDTFLKNVRGEKDTVDWLERILFRVGI